jgi:hypothetical protein
MLASILIPSLISIPCPTNPPGISNAIGLRQRFNRPWHSRWHRSFCPAASPFGRSWMIRLPSIVLDVCRTTARTDRSIQPIPPIPTARNTGTRIAPAEFSGDFHPTQFRTVPWSGYVIDDGGLRDFLKTGSCEYRLFTSIQHHTKSHSDYPRRILPASQSR